MDTKLRPNHHLDLTISGLGGWLILVQIGLFISLARAVYYLLDAMSVWKQWDTIMDEESFYYDPLWPSLTVFESVYNGFIVIFCLYIVINFYMKKSIVPRLMIILYSSNLLAAVIDYAMIQQITFAKQLDNGDAEKVLYRAILAAAIWIPYFLRSRRVRQTFVR
ncbi:DUF2569 domain-containing protein [Marinicrinis lubricantis]|uniref:DUF2569 domain-containing protein n=1 Tax=Marinicrinis lubricantis TaxID=2086470 RepID=A0ABW1INZ4_9BACL